MNTSVISIIIPTYNRVDLLRETLDSVRAQTYANWEAIVVDDCSSDDTETYVSEIEAEEPRVRYLRRQGDQGNANVCRNQGLAAANGEYVVFLDSDDLIMPDCLERRIAIMERNLDLDFAVFPAMKFVDSPDEPTGTFGEWNGTGDLDRLLRLNWPIQTTGPIWRSGVFDRIGTWDERLPSWQDWEFILRAIALGAKYLRFPDHDYYFRVKRHEEKTSHIQFRSESHLLAAVDMLDRVYELLSERGLLSADRRTFLSRIYLRLALSMFNNEKGLAGARHVWGHVSSRKIRGTKIYLLGVFLLYLNKYPSLRRLGIFQSLEYRVRRLASL